ncbi:MAG: hypothetical protein WCL10_16395 [Novosphingobium sp.]|uniref:hypothetical protein n=1 Tax=Novosphingobium sp. TaxID=1874826 RepID=UPI00301B32A3
MVVFAVFAVFASGMLAIGLARLFSRWGAWLPVIITTVLPPLVFVPFGVFQQLVAIGAEAETTERTPPHAVDDFVSGLSNVLAMAGIWLVVGFAVSIFDVRKYRSANPMKKTDIFK